MDEREYHNIAEQIKAMGGIDTDEEILGSRCQMNKKQVRQTFRNEVFSRDHYVCQGCGLQSSKETAEEELDSHHIINRTEFLNGGYVKENGISLCKDICHLKAEKYHITGGKEWEQGFHPDDLYAKIASSEELARQADKNRKD